MVDFMDVADATHCNDDSVYHYKGIYLVCNTIRDPYDRHYDVVFKSTTTEFGQNYDVAKKYVDALMSSLDGMKSLESLKSREVIKETAP